MLINIIFSTVLAFAQTHYSKNIDVSTSKAGSEKTVAVLVEYKDGYGWNSYFQETDSGLSKQEQELVSEYAVKMAKKKFEEDQAPPKLTILSADESSKPVVQPKDSSVEEPIKEPSE